MRSEEEDQKRGFTFVDKRGQNNPVQEKLPTHVQSPADVAPLNTRSWKSVGYRIYVNPGPEGQPIVLGRVAGLATDGECFTADWIFGPNWEAGLDWTIDAKRRLDTFLTCQCASKVGHCSFHRRKLNGGWAKEDMDRIKSDCERTVPEVFEVLFKAEQTRSQAQRILAPRR